MMADNQQTPQTINNYYNPVYYNYGVGSETCTRTDCIAAKEEFKVQLQNIEQQLAELSARSGFVQEFPYARIDDSHQTSVKAVGTVTDYNDARTAVEISWNSKYSDARSLKLGSEPISTNTLENIHNGSSITQVEQRQVHCPQQYVTIPQTVLHEVAESSFLANRPNSSSVTQVKQRQVHCPQQYVTTPQTVLHEVAESSFLANRPNNNSITRVKQRPGEGQCQQRHVTTQTVLRREPKSTQTSDWGEEGSQQNDNNTHDENGNTREVIDEQLNRDQTDTTKKIVHKYDDVEDVYQEWPYLGDYANIPTKSLLRTISKPMTAHLQLNSLNQVHHATSSTDDHATSGTNDQITNLKTTSKNLHGTMELIPKVTCNKIDYLDFSMVNKSITSPSPRTSTKTDQLPPTTASACKPPRASAAASLTPTASESPPPLPMYDSRPPLRSKSEKAKSSLNTSTFSRNQSTRSVSYRLSKVVYHSSVLKQKQKTKESLVQLNQSTLGQTEITSLEGQPKRFNEQQHNNYAEVFQTTATSLSKSDVQRLVAGEPTLV